MAIFMLFPELYRFSNEELTSPRVGFSFLAGQIAKRHPDVERVEKWECDLDIEVSMGHMVFEDQRSSPYNEAENVAVIRFARALNRCWRRLVCTKELMHVFDSQNAQTGNGQKFVQLLNELETAPLDASAMFTAERAAVWMALLVLCPLRLRQLHVTGDDSDQNVLVIAHRLKVPVAAVRAIRRDYYLEALDRLTR
jgi:hypothetical protein